MTSNQQLALGVGLVGLFLLSRKTAAAVSTTPVVAPARGVISYPGYGPTSYSGIQPGGGSGVMTPTPVLAIAPSFADTQEIYGTGMTASELKAIGYTDSQISAMAMSGDPAISSILNLTPPTPVLAADPVYDYLSALPVN